MAMAQPFGAFRGKCTGEFTLLMWLNLAVQSLISIVKLLRKTKSSSSKTKSKNLVPKFFYFHFMIKMFLKLLGVYTVYMLQLVNLFMTTKPE